MPDDIAGKVFVLAKKLAQKMTDQLGCEGFNIVQNNGIVAGQTVFHFHLHLIPRYVDDQQKICWDPREMSAEELDGIKEMLSK